MPKELLSTDSAFEVEMTSDKTPHSMDASFLVEEAANKNQSIEQFVFDNKDNSQE